MTTIEGVARPRLTDLIDDPTCLSRGQLLTALLRPWPPFAAFVAFAELGWWIPAAASIAFVFAATVVVIHDLFHRNLGLSSRLNHALVTIYGTLILNSGHALATTHLQHHRIYPQPNDPEAYVDGWPVWRVLLEGPRYRFRVWAWAWANHRAPRQSVEMGLWLTAWVAALTLRYPALLGYVLLAEIGTWTFPLISVTGVHDRHQDHPLRQTRTLRSTKLGPLMLGMQYHLEHHLYPRVPAPRLPELAQALDPWLTEHNAAIWRPGQHA